MEIIDEEQFNDALKLPKIIKPLPGGEMQELTDADFNLMLDAMSQPVGAQKQLAVQIKCFLDHRIKFEMEKSGVLSDHTRRWVESYNSILGDVHRALYGDKSINLHLHKVSHSHIMSKIRKVNKDDNNSGRRKPGNDKKDRK